MKQNRHHKIRLRFNTLLVFMLVGTFHICANAYSQTARVSLNVKNATIEEVFHELEKATNYIFLYKSEVVQGKKAINVDANNKPLTQVLNEVLTSAGLTYAIDDNVIVVSSSKSNSANPQQRPSTRVIKGKVFDESNYPLIGVTVKLKGNNKTATFSDTDGNYQISIPADATQTLVFSYVGMEQLEMTVGRGDILNAQMNISSIGLGDVVIEAGYGLAQKRSDMVGSAYQVAAKDIQNLPSARIDNLLEGLVPGLAIGYNSDSEGSVRPRLSTRIRGEGSLGASSEPIWIVDGTRIYSGERTNMAYGVNSTLSPLSYLDPNDIESFTVLKDPSTIALYGADGSNGVILITTKKGKVSNPQIRASVKYSLDKTNKSTRFKVLNAQEYMTLAKESYMNRYAATDPDMIFFPYQNVENNMYSNNDTNWYDKYLGTGNTAEVNVSYTGGSEKMQNYVSTSYYQKEYATKGNDQQRFSLRTNTDVEILKKLTFSVGSSFSYNVSNIFSPGTDYYAFLPIISPYNEDGTYRMYYSYIEKDAAGIPSEKSSKFFNSLAERDENDNKQRTFAGMANLSLSYDILEGLNLTGQFGVDYKSTQENTYGAMSNWSGRDSNANELGYATRSSSNTFLWNSVVRLNYNRTFGKHTVGALAGFEASSDERRYTQATGNTFANDHIKEITYAVSRVGSSGEVINHVLSYFGQASYSFDRRYYLTLNTRRDGNSDFGEDVQWAQFGSLGASWNIHNESFFNIDKINVLKLKASYGTSGNSRLGNMQAKGLYNYGNSYNGDPASVMSSIQNKKLSWETSYMTNIGLRVRFMDRWDMEVEVYNKKTEDMLSNHAISMTTGATAIDANVGSMQNRGVEITIESINLKAKNFDWTTTLNMSHTKNKILELEAPRLGSTNKVWEVGGDKNRWNLVRWAGVNPRNGEPLWYDDKGNITNVYSTSYAVPYKTSVPTWEGGISNEFRYKDFSLSVLMTYMIGGYGFSSFSSNNTTSDGYQIMSQNQSVNQLDRWQKPGDLAISPKPIWGISNGSSRASTRFLFNKTHLRLKNIALGYNIPKSYVRSIGITNASVLLALDNIAIWTPYDKSDRNSYRQSMSGYPMESSVTIGLNATF